MRTTTSAPAVLTVLILLTPVAPAMAGEALRLGQQQNPVQDSRTQIAAKWADSARDARRKQILQGLAVVGGSMAGGLLVGRAIDIGSGPNLTPWALVAGVGIGTWLAADVVTWRTFRAAAAPTRGGMRAAMSIRW